MFYCCRRLKFAPKILLCGISIWLTVTYSSAAHRVNFCVSTAKWLPESTAILRYKYTAYIFSFTVTIRSVLEPPFSRDKKTCPAEEMWNSVTLVDIRTTQHFPVNTLDFTENEIRMTYHCYRTPFTVYRRRNHGHKMSSASHLTSLIFFQLPTNGSSPYFYDKIKLIV